MKDVHKGDAYMMKARSRLLLSGAYCEAAHRKWFDKGMDEIARWHEYRNSFYKQWRQEQRKNGQPWPFLPSNLLKDCPTLSIPKFKVVMTLQSSGTTGHRSRLVLDGKSYREGMAVGLRLLGYHQLISLEATNYLIMGLEPSKEPAGHMMVLSGVRHLTPIKETVYGLVANRENPHDLQTITLNMDSIIQKLRQWEKGEHPLRIIGFPGFIQDLMKGLREREEAPFCFPKGWVLTGGGWKGREPLRGGMEALRKEMGYWFGVNSNRCRDVYTALEQPIPFIECEAHHMHIPTYCRVQVRDFKTLEPLPEGETGLLHFMSPLCTSMPIHSILMSDYGRVMSAKHCSCGNSRPYLIVEGRLDSGQRMTCSQVLESQTKGRGL